MKIQILYIVFSLFCWSIASDVIIHLFDNEKIVQLDENDIQDNKEDDSDPQELFIHHPNLGPVKVGNAHYIRLYVFFESALKELPEIPPPDRA